MDEMKKAAREGETATRKQLREVDGHTVSDDVANAGDEIRKNLGNAGDDARSAVRNAGDRVREDADRTGSTEPVRRDLR